MSGGTPVDLTVVAIPAFLVLLVVEAVVAARRGRAVFEARDTMASLAMGVGSVVVNLGWKGVVFVAYEGLYRYSPLDLGHGPLAWLAALVGVDVCYYWFHRLHHEVRILWAAHVAHHSSLRYNFATALRQTWTPMTGLLFYAPLPLLGIDPVLVLASYGVNLLYQFWIHTELIDRLGPLEWILNTPSHHRVHHGSNRRYLDRNHGGILIVWDRLFGTFEPEGEPVRYGLTRNLGSYNPLRIAFHEFVDIARDVRGARSLRERLAYCFAPPGWTPGERRAQAVPASLAAE
jgi:sterol desaturase/sphingolipid hydroxylase (fatty acid hydroxylase superfamily)